MSNLTYFVYTAIPHSGKGWTLAVLATGRREADTYVKNVHRGGKFSHSITSGTVKADCGAVTAEAQEVLRDRLARPHPTGE